MYFRYYVDIKRKNIDEHSYPLHRGTGHHLSRGVTLPISRNQKTPILSWSEKKLRKYTTLILTQDEHPSTPSLSFSLPPTWGALEYEDPGTGC